VRPCAYCIEEVGGRRCEGAAAVGELRRREREGACFGEILRFDEGDSEAGCYGIGTWMNEPVSFRTSRQNLEPLVKLTEGSQKTEAGWAAAHADHIVDVVWPCRVGAPHAPLEASGAATADKWCSPAQKGTSCCHDLGRRVGRVVVRERFP
jgi:hypothetical protein